MHTLRPSLRAAWAAAAVTLLAQTAPAHAHASLEQPSAVAGSYYKAVVMIGHGCEGQATHTVRIRLPAGFNGAKPMPKPGWTLAIQREKLAQPYLSHGKEITDTVTQVTWTADSAAAHLPDAQYDEFVLRGQLPATPGPLWFKVQQLCPSGQLDWSEVPASGTSTKGLKSPAVLLNVTPDEADPHAHHH